jgi:nitrite reductase (NADH) small subunit
MRVVTFNPNTHNFIVSGQESYFIFQTDEGEKLLLSTRCSHKGGPLHLGYHKCAKQGLVCPWHDRVYSQKNLQNRALPLIFRADKVTIVIDKIADNGIVGLFKTTVLANHS